MKLNELNSEEKRVIISKGTEYAFSGIYDKFYEEGVYTCKQCDAPLYNSTSKFNSQCGWPSFDDEIDGAVKRIADADGRRTEIVCANCGGHLGHVFLNEGYTSKNTRHCVNSVSMNFVENQDKYKKALFASGCFWGTEYWMEKQEGVISVVSGYTGGTIDNPTYNLVSSGNTNHAETVEVTYNPDLISYNDLVKMFFETHDPTQQNKQGPDIGTQYRSAIFYLSDEQKEIAEKYKNILIDKGYNVVTEITKASKFYDAEDFHQNYYNNKGTMPTCHVYKAKF
ncbi:MAG: bifunctional methionine sulfoxide reductase B/A protein [Ichthyobacteriaceae bacterium]|nr:bifunctional methionine sulfoxide reductase B/A protein [Ichthyobacteriaceae bacterium]